MTAKSFKKWFGEFPKTQFKIAMTNTENLVKKGVQKEVWKNAWKKYETPCLWILKNSGFALDGLLFSRFPVSSTNWEN